MKRVILTLAILGLLSNPVLAATNWDVSPGRSSVKFKVKHLLFQEVEGKFKKFEGRVVAPNQDLSNSQMEARIKVSSIYTGNDDRDHHLNSPDFFAVNKFPDIVFRSKAVKKVSPHTYKIQGELTIRGVTKPIELTAKCHKHKVLSNGKTRMDLEATGSLSRFDYGLKWNELMETGGAIVGEDVKIILNLALMKG